MADHKQVVDVEDGSHRTPSPVDPEKRVPLPTANKASQRVLAHSHDADEAMKAFESGEIIEIDEATNTRLLHIIDWHLLPLMCVVYGLNYLDKTTLSYASIMGIKKDIGLVGDDYQWLGSMFYFGYMFWEYPTNRLLQKLPLGKYSAFNVVMWGTILALHATVWSFGSAVTARLFLGVFEAAVTPGFMLLVSQWWTKAEQGARTGLWFSFASVTMTPARATVRYGTKYACLGNGMGQIFGGLVAYGINVGSEKYGSTIAPWKVVFLVNGLLTAALGVVFYFVIPDNQLNARWLSPKDRILAVARVRVNQQGIGNKHFKSYQLKEALRDPMTWAFVFYALIADIPNGGISNFFSQLIVSFGYTPSQSLLYGTPGGAVEVVALIFCGWYGDRIGNRILVSMLGLITALLGIILIVALPLSNNGGRLAGYYMTQASPTPFVAILSLIATNVAGYTKKTTIAALYLIGYCVGNIIGPQTFRPEDAPRYVPAEITIIACWGVCLLDLVFMYLWYRRENARKARVRAEEGYVKLENQEWLDLTDRENMEFTYAL